MIYLKLLLCYLKIGFFGFGGGYSMLSLLHHEVVVNHQWISSAELSDILAISQMTPGPIAINSATYIGYTIAGIWGSIIATVAVCLPSLTIMVILTRFIMRLKDSKYLECVMTSMRPAIMGMIASAAILLLFPEQREGASMIDAWSWVLFAGAFIASLRHFSPIKLIVLSAVAGIAIYYIPEVVAGESEKQEGKSIEVKQNSHIWRGYDITSSEVIASSDFQQSWVDYLYTLQGQNAKTASSNIKTTFRRTESNPEALSALFELTERYLYNPNSPIPSDELFIPALEFMIESPAVDPLLKMRPEALLAIVSKNRIGRVASDFTLDGKSGKRMHQIVAPYTLLYFYDPECHDCQRVGEIMKSSALLSALEQRGILHIAKTLITEGSEINTLYDLKATPTIYLLDSEKKVLLKDAPIEMILDAVQPLIKD